MRRVQRVAQSVLILAVAVCVAAAPAAAREFENRSITFSGLNWLVKGSRGRIGPGHNHFSDSFDNVWVDAQGRLHLRVN